MVSFDSIIKMLNEKEDVAGSIVVTMLNQVVGSLVKLLLVGKIEGGDQATFESWFPILEKYDYDIDHPDLQEKTIYELLPSIFAVLGQKPEWKIPFKTIKEILAEHARNCIDCQKAFRENLIENEEADQEAIETMEEYGITDDHVEAAIDLAQFGYKLELAQIVKKARNSKKAQEELAKLVHQAKQKDLEKESRCLLLLYVFLYHHYGTEKNQTEKNKFLETAYAMYLLSEVFARHIRTISK